MFVRSPDGKFVLPCLRLGKLGEDVFRGSWPHNCLLCGLLGANRGGRRVRRRAMRVQGTRVRGVRSLKQYFNTQYSCKNSIFKFLVSRHRNTPTRKLNLHLEILFFSPGSHGQSHSSLLALWQLHHRYALPLRSRHHVPWRCTVSHYHFSLK